MKYIFALICLFWSFNQTFAATYYCDPAKGNMKNTGAYRSPWSSLDSVFITGKKLLPGDTLFLRNGNHGSPIISGNLESTAYITILPQNGHRPTAVKLIVTNAKNWTISGLKISADMTGLLKADFVSIKSSASLITIDNFNISSTDSCINNWSALKLLARAGLGIRVDGQDCTINNNLIRQVSFGIVVGKTGTRAKVSRNNIYGFLHDGLRGLADDSIFEYNLVAGCYAIDDNHDDGFQSWSTDETGKVGLGKVSNVTLRGNVLISQLDPNQPFPQKVGMQGIGCFDGFFENWTVENNVVITNMWHGISLYGLKNSKITHNTVIVNPLQQLKAKPWIGVYNHKKLGESASNTVSHNLATGFSEKKGVVQEIGNVEITVEQLNDYFQDWKLFNLSPKSGKKAKANVGADLTLLPKINPGLLVCDPKQ